MTHLIYIAIVVYTLNLIAHALEYDVKRWNEQLDAGVKPTLFR